MDFLGWGKSNFYSVFYGPPSTCNERPQDLLKQESGLSSKGNCGSNVFLFFPSWSKDLSYNINRQQSRHKNYTFLYMIFLWKCMQEEAICIGQPPQCYFYEWNLVITQWQEDKYSLAKETGKIFIFVGLTEIKESKSQSVHPMYSSCYQQSKCYNLTS